MELYIDWYRNNVKYCYWLWIKDGGIDRKSRFSITALDSKLGLFEFSSLYSEQIEIYMLMLMMITTLTRVIKKKMHFERRLSYFNNVLNVLPYPPLLSYRQIISISLR